MASGFGYLGAILGFGEETVYGTAVAVTKFLELNVDSLDLEEDRLHSGAIPAVYNDDDEVIRAGINPGGAVGFEMRYEGMEVLLKHAMGSVSTAEVASFTVDATNNKINFNIGAAELIGTLVNGTYIAGTTQATAASMCKMIYDAIVAAEAEGTYTVSFSPTTKKFTITRSAGTFEILWKTGTNGSDGTDTHCGTLCGFSDAANDTGALTYTSDTAVVSLYDHTFTLANDLPTGLTLEVDRDLKAFTYEGSKITGLKMNIDSGGFLMCNLDIVAKEVTNAAATSQTLPTAGLVNFTQGAITFGAIGAINITKLDFSLNNNLKVDRRFIGSRNRAEPIRNGKREITGTFNLEYTDELLYDDFRAATSRALAATFTGGIIKAGFAYTVTITFGQVKLTKALPLNSSPGVIMYDIPFKAYAADSSTLEFTIVIRNTVASISA